MNIAAVNELAGKINQQMPYHDSHLPALRGDANVVYDGDSSEEQPDGS